VRLFAAVRPPEHVLLHLEQALAGVGSLADGAGVRWSSEENLHLTLAFFGDVPDGAVDALGDGLARAGGRALPFRLSLRGAGVFGSRTLWIGAGGAVESMVGLAAAARAEGEGVSRFRDERPRQRPHLTVGRVVQSRTGRRRGAPRLPVEAVHLVRALAVYEGPEWTVDEALLLSSVPGAGRGGGPLYEIVQSARVGTVAG